jgi:hypothetical protein
MDDLTVLKAVGATLDLANDEPPSALRHRVVAGFSQPAPRRHRLRMPSLGWSVAATAGLAAALAVALIAGNTGGPGSRSPDDRNGAVPAGASDILLRAAQTARADPTTPPRPDQFVYVESIDAYQGSEVTPDGQQRFFPIQPKLRRVWLSADGTRDGLLRESAAPGQPPARDIIPERLLPGCRNGREAVLGTDAKVVPGRTRPCVPRPAYRPDLPTDAEGMLRYLREGKGGRSDKDLFDKIADLLGESYLSPPQRAAVFEAASRLSGVVVVPDVADIAGRHGIAVAWTLHYPDPEVTPAQPSAGQPRPVAQAQLMFDPVTYAYLGDRTVVTADVADLKAGTVLGQRAVLKVGTVDQVDQRP